MQLISITSGDYSAVIDVDHGANCIRLRNHRYDAKILREKPSLDAVPENPFLYGMPVLFPVNRISGGRFTFEGREYQFPINEPKTNCHLHGLLHQTAFDVIEQTENHLVCRYRATAEQPYLNFPHEFSLTMTYELGADGLYHTAEIINHSDRTMPCLLGFHTTFQTLLTPRSKPENSLVQAEIAAEFERNESYLPTGKQVPFDKASRELLQGSFCPAHTSISRHYRASGNGNMSITDTEQGLRMVYRNDAAFPYRLILNSDREHYVCLEPQNCLVNCFNAPFATLDKDSISIPPQSKKIFTSHIYLESI
ncbi:MAG: aldose 1-epimerase [Clostridia bacterium]|nr:aldose 1-epimerase [Clostridia bacterium]